MKKLLDANPTALAHSRRDRLLVTLAKLAGIIFIAAVGVMWFLPLLRLPEGPIKWLVDGALLTGFCSPLIYWLFVRPRGRAEEVSRESEERYRSLIETSSQCVSNLDLDGNFVYMNPVGLSCHKMSGDEVKGVHCTKLAKPAYHNQLNEALEKAKRGESIKLQYECDTSSGSRWFESVLSPIKDDSGEVESLLRISEDITERKQAEEALRKSEENFRSIFHSVPESLLAMNKQMEVLSSNKAYEKLIRKYASRLNMSEDELREKILSELRKHIKTTKHLSAVPAQAGGIIEIGMSSVGVESSIGN